MAKITNKQNKQKMIEVGEIAYRDADGNFTGTKPLFMESTPELEKAKEELMQSAVNMFTDDLAAYIAKLEK